VRFNVLSVGKISIDLSNRFRMVFGGEMSRIIKRSRYSTKHKQQNIILLKNIAKTKNCVLVKSISFIHVI